MEMAQTSARVPNMERHHIFIVTPSQSRTSTHGTPVRKNIGDLPALPIFIHFPDSLEGSDASSDDSEDDILEALGTPIVYALSSLVCHVHVQRDGYSDAVAGAVSGINTPFAWIVTILPGAFLGRGVPRSQQFYLDGTPFPAIPTPSPLLSARDVVDVDLRGIPDTGRVTRVSPEAVVTTSLAALSRREYPTLGFRWGP